MYSATYRALTAWARKLSPSVPTVPSTPQGEWGWFEPAEPSVTYVYEHGWKRVRLDVPLRYHAPDGVTYSACAGLETDGASIPWILAPLAGQRLSGPHLLPAIIHDALCIRAKAIGGADGLSLRRTADRLFPAMLRACGAGWWSAVSKGAAVRLGTLATRVRGDWREGVGE
jgi:hypothetical protein